MFKEKLREIFLIFKFEIFKNYSFMLNCGSGGRFQIANFVKKASGSFNYYKRMT